MSRSEVRQVLISARAFYFVMFALFQFATLYYPNKLRTAFSDNSIFYLVLYYSVHLLALYLFLTAGSNPGFVDETETPNSRREKAMLFVGGQYDEFKGVQDEETQGSNVTEELDGGVKGGEKSYEVLDQSLTTSPNTGEGTSTRRLDEVKSIEHRSKMPMPAKRFCEYCAQEQPYRSKHCKECERCVRKYDHHCFWVGGCVGELNHRKFWGFLFFQTWHFFMCFSIALSGYDAKTTVSTNVDDQNHVGSVWLSFLTMIVVFIFFTGMLLVYHTYLLLSGQTTWEHSRRDVITYLRIYPTGVMPFYEGIIGNLKRVFLHEGKCVDWELRQPYEIREAQGFNLCENEYYSCC